jgi:hypothetical protein
MRCTLPKVVGMRWVHDGPPEVCYRVEVSELRPIYLAGRCYPDYVRVFSTEDRWVEVTPDELRSICAVGVGC